MHKLLKMLLSSAMAISLLPTSLAVKANGGNVEISENETTISIGNAFIKRQFSKQNGKFKTESIENNRINEVFEPDIDSDDFVIYLLNDKKEEEEPKVVLPTNALNREQWKGTLKNSSGKEFKTTQKLFDGNPNSSIDEYTLTGHPFSLEIDLQTAQDVSSFSYLKRPGFHEAAYGVNGSIGRYKLYVSDDGTTWKKAGKGEFTREDYNLHKEGNLFNVGDPVYANFDQTYHTRYVKIEVLDDVLGHVNEFTGAEINLYSDQVKTGGPQHVVNLLDKKVTLKGKEVKQFTDGNPYNYTGGNVNDEIIFDLGTTTKVGSFEYTKRPGFHEAAYGVNGTMGRYELFVSDDGVQWTNAGKGEFTRDDYNLHNVTLEQDLQTQDGNYKAGTTLYNFGTEVYGNFKQVYETRFVKIVPKSDCLGGTNEFCAAEIRLFEDQVQENALKDKEIHTSDLEIEEITKGTNEVRVSFKPYLAADVTWSIDYVIMMEDTKHYMNSYLEISADKPEQARIDYIDFDHFVINSETTKDVWSIPDENKISSMWLRSHELMLGQPIYADGLFFGSEFPAQETDVVDDVMQIRYYSGKSIARMAKDEQNVINGNTFRTWNNVVGAAQGTPSDVVQTDFFAYIEDIATPSTFRKQYNSWYDNMMGISESSIEKSFLGSEKGLSQNGIEPLDSYVVDDGWNNYNDGVHVHPYESGTTPNQTGFWEFNNKFPNELYVSSHLVKKLNSSFGVWVGPRGGYNFPGELAQMFEKNGTGYVHSTDHDVCTGSRKYIKNFEKRFVDYQTRFDIDYWKWDGFSLHPCSNPEHDHMVGGNREMYYTSDMWEAWTDLFEHAREARRKQGKGLWINATCYVNLSPWLLQWVNTIWVQDSGDTGQAGDKTAARHQQKIYYRDQVYYQLYKQNQVQFPLKNIYNHDPIYGVSDGSNATTEVFREFLFDNAMRGTAFWELYYSPSLFDDAKWKVTVDALDFAENNHDVLKNAKLFVEAGKKPVNGVYGYSAWNDTEGIVSFVNPTNSEQTYELVLNNVVGVPTSMSGLKETQIYPYASTTAAKTVKYGDTLQVTLAPFSSQIYKYSNQDTTAPQLVSAKIMSDSTVEVRFNERVNDDMTFMINQQACQATLLDDYRTVAVSTTGLGDVATLAISNVKDIYGNAAEAIETEIRTASNIVDIKTKKDLTNKETKASDSFRMDAEQYEVTKDGITGTNDFSVNMMVATLENDATLVQQGNDYEVSIDQDGYAVFKVGQQAVSSKDEETTVVEKAHGTFNTDDYVETTTNVSTVGKINDGKQHVINAVREKNGVLKLYVDGRLTSSAYDQGKKANLKGEPIVVGSTSFYGIMGSLTVKNSAVYYDDAMDLANAYNVYDSYISHAKDGWQASACSEANAGTDGGAKDTIDGNDQTYWHSNYNGSDTCKGTHTLRIDFNKAETFDTIRYTARPNGDNGNWQTVTILGVAQDGTETVLMENQSVVLEDKMSMFHFDTLQTYHGLIFKIKGSGGFASAAEIDVLTKHVVYAKEVITLQKEAHDLFVNTKPSETNKEQYQLFVDKVNEIMDLPLSTTVEEIQQKRDELYELHNQLETSSITPVRMSATLTDKISMNVYFDIEPSVLEDDQAYVEFSVNPKQTHKVMLKGLQPEENGLYKLSMPLYARQMSDEITMNVHTSNEDQTHRYSIQMYGEKVLASANATADQKAVVEAMLNYGAMSQVYFGYHTETLANANVTNKEYETITAQQVSDYAYTITGKVAGVCYGTSNLRLLSETAIRHHFVVNAEIENLYKAGTVNFVLVNGDEETTLKPTFYDGNKAYVEVEHIFAKNLDKAYTVKVINTQTKEELTIAYSTFSYAKEVLEKSSNGSLQDVVKAMVVYNQKAKAYQASIQ